MSIRAPLIAVAGLLFTIPCRAQEVPEQPPKQGDEGVNASRFFQAAQAAFAEGRFVDAARSFEEAFRIKPHPAPLINAGDAWEKAGEYANAARSFQKALSLPQASERDRADAVERLARLKPQLGELQLLGDSSIRVRIDDEDFQGGETAFLFPGEHRVTLADVEGAKTRTLNMIAGTVRSIDVTTLRPDIAAPKAGAGEPTADAQAAAGPRRGFSPSIPTIAGFGVGLVAAGAAVYFGLQVNDAESSFNDDPNREDFDRFNDNKLLMNVSLGVGVVGLGVGTFFLFRDISRAREPQADAARGFGPGFASLEVVPSTHGATLRAAGRF